MAKIIPFPLDRRVDLLVKQAAWFSMQKREAAEKNLAYLLKLERKTMARWGLSPEAIEAEVTALEEAIRQYVGPRARGNYP